jgi:5,10-methylenetetrahydromethanopterin reductase
MTDPSISRLRVGIVLAAAGPSRNAMDMARLAERLGFDSAWMYENLYFPGALSTAGAAIACTTRLRVGIGTVSPYTRNPVIYAMEAGQLHELSRGRFVIGLGASPPAFLERIGINARHPLATMRETIAIMRALFRGGIERFDGEAFTVHDVHLSFEPAAGGPPIWIGAIGDRMLRLTGEVADGLIFSVLCPHPFIVRAMNRLAEGAAIVGRRPNLVDSVAYVPFALLDDRAKARAMLKPHIALMVSRTAGKAELEVLFTRDQLFTSDQMVDIAQRYRAGEAPDAYIPDHVVDALCIAGDEDDCRRGLAAYADLGVGEVALFGLDVQPESQKMLKRLARSLEREPIVRRTDMRATEFISPP